MTIKEERKLKRFIKNIIKEEIMNKPSEEEIALRILGMPFREFYHKCAKSTFMSPREEALLQQYRKELKKYGLYEANHKHRYIDYIVDADPNSEFDDDYEYDFGNFDDYISPDDVNVPKAKHKALTDMMPDFRSREKDYDYYNEYDVIAHRNPKYYSRYADEVNPLFKTPQKMSLHYKPKTNN